MSGTAPRQSFSVQGFGNACADAYSTSIKSSSTSHVSCPSTRCLASYMLEGIISMGFGGVASPNQWNAQHLDLQNLEAGLKKHMRTITPTPAI